MIKLIDNIIETLFPEEEMFAKIIKSYWLHTAKRVFYRNADQKFIRNCVYYIWQINQMINFRASEFQFNMKSGKNANPDKIET